MKNLENAERVHGAQRVRGPRAQQHLAQAVPQKWAFGHLHSEHGERVGNAVFGSVAEAVRQEWS